MTKEHPTGSFLDLANRLEIRDAWFHIIDRGGLQSAKSKLEAKGPELFTELVFSLYNQNLTL